jgi:hypothetical protein
MHWHEFFIVPNESFYQLKFSVMERRGTDNNGNGSTSNAQKGDLASKGGPTTGLGKADNDHRISKPYSSDLQTQIATRGKKPKKKKS